MGRFTCKIMRFRCIIDGASRKRFRKCLGCVLRAVYKKTLLVPAGVLYAQLWCPSPLVDFFKRIRIRADCAPYATHTAFHLPGIQCREAPRTVTRACYFVSMNCSIGFVLATWTVSSLPLRISKRLFNNVLLSE